MEVSMVMSVGTAVALVMLAASSVAYADNFPSAPPKNPPPPGGNPAKDVVVGLTPAQGHNRKLSQSAAGYIPAPCNEGCAWGAWKNAVRCPPGTVARTFQMRAEKPQGKGDDTAVNAVSMGCYTRKVTMSGIGVAVGTITSDQGMWGDWSNWQVCPKGSFIYGVRLYVEKPQGKGDDTSVNDVQFLCRNGEKVTSRKFSTVVLKAENRLPWGTEQAWAYCDSGAVVGFQIKLEPSQGKGDDTAMNQIAIACGWY